MLLAMGFLRLGFLANFLSHPVISGFITASGIIIAAAQLKHILGINAGGHNLYELAISIWQHLPEINLPTLGIGIFATGFLYWARKGLKPFLLKRGLRPKLADILAKTGPVAAVALTTLVTFAFGLETMGVSVVGHVPAGLPVPTLPPLDFQLWLKIATPALLIAVIGYVETISVASTLAAKRRQRVDPDQELIALGAANIGSAMSGGFPVTGGFSPLGGEL